MLFLGRPVGSSRGEYPSLVVSSMRSSFFLVILVVSALPSVCAWGNDPFIQVQNDDEVASGAISPVACILID